MFMQTRSLKKIFKWPVILGVFTVFGLVEALLIEGGALEIISLIVLSTPVAVIIYFYYYRN